MRVGDLRARAANGGRVSLALVLSYAFDWFILAAAVGVGGALSFISPNKRPFALNDTRISFPFVENEKVPAFSLFIIGGIGPLVIIAAIALFLVPGPTVPKSTPKSLIWRRKLWELHTGWLGLGLALASAFVITQGMKNLFGKPRPDLLSRCIPNLAEKEKFVLGGFAEVDPAFLVYSAAICTSTDKHKLDDGFRSFPSGHSSFSSSGLIYLSLFIASKLAITIPFLPANAYTADEFAAFPSRMSKSSSRINSNGTRSSSNDSLEEAATDQKIVAARNQAAAPPVYLLVFAIIPFFASIYISSTRFSDFRHHGFDILFGYTIGVVTAIFAFRYYHLPISKGAGWSWGPRSKDRSFWAGVGVGNYVGDRGRKQTQQRDARRPRESPPRTESGMTEVDLERANSFDQPSSHDVGNGGYSQQLKKERESSH
jgi:membrane-associated phospholipid phosphatase